jgi:hypothetical protein
VVEHSIGDHEIEVSYTFICNHVFHPGGTNNSLVIEDTVINSYCSKLFRVENNETIQIINTFFLGSLH